MLFEVGFAHPQRTEQIALGGFVEHHVGHDALGLDRLAARRVVARGGDLQRRLRRQLAHRLHRALAEGLRAHHDGAMVILQRTGDDFARRCRAFIDQHDQRHRLHCIGQLAQRVRAAAAQVELGRGLEGRLRFGDLSVGRHDHGVARQEGRGHRDRCFEQAARIVAQVEHEALQVRVLLVDVFELLREVVDRAVLELADAQPGITGLDELGAHALHADLFAHDRHREAARLALAEDAEDDFGARLAAHALDRLVHRQALDHGVVDLGDQVTALQASAEGRRALDRRDDLDEPVFHADLDADADELAGRAFAEFLECLLVEVLRVRVEAGHHATDRVGDQLLLVDRLDVVALDHAKDGGELLQLFERKLRHGVSGDRLQLHRCQRARHGTECNPARNPQFRTHIQPASCLR